MSILKSSIAAACMAACSLAMLPAHAGLFDDDEARKAILDLRAKQEAALRDINARLDEKADKSGILDLVNQNEQLKQEVAKLRGMVEVLTNDLATAQQRQKDFYGDLDGRLQKLEPKKVSVDGRDASVGPSEENSYTAALELFKSGDYKSAGAAFADFLRRYPQSAYAADAQYGLGNSYYVQRDYRNAIASQQAVVKNYPDSPKVPEALLVVASCYTELRDKVAAKKTLETIVSQFPEAPAAQNAKDRLASLK